MKRLELAQAGGNRYYQRLLISEKLQGAAKPVLGAGDIQFLSQPEENGNGRGYGVIADYYRQRGENTEMIAARRKAADAGWADAAGFGWTVDEFMQRSSHALVEDGRKSFVKIAEELDVSEATVRTQVKSILAKLDVTSQLAAVGAAHQASWSPPVLAEDR